MRGDGCKKCSGTYRGGLKVSSSFQKSSFSKFDALQKKTVLHVRSSEASKAPEKFNVSSAIGTAERIVIDAAFQGSTPADISHCKSCTKPVFQMEQIKAEKAIWHKNCFRCNECNKQLT